MTIKLLDKETVARIAAGEVVERPASIVKELIENALDAGATEITLEIKGGGLKLIRVSDNGSGIAPGEVELAFERHATSKIQSLDDLESLHTLGFRGEALPSVAAVAVVEIVTAVEGETGALKLRLEDGRVVEKKWQGRSRGTTIEATDLFRRIPARLKFMKSVNTENQHITNVFTQYALAYPEVRFRLLIEDKETVRTPGSGILIDAILGVYGEEIARGMLEVDNRGQWGSGLAIQVTGMAGSPSISRASRGYLSYFVNRRWINSRLITRAVEEAYHGLLLINKHPVAVLNITISPADVDVNVHPTKTEVRFRDEQAVFVAVQRAVRRTILGENPTPQIDAPPPAYILKPPPLRQTIPGFQVTLSASRNSFFSGQTPSMPVLARPVLRVLGQLLNSYIIAEGSDGLYIIDQHAAHERVQFEKISEKSRRRETAVQGLLEPVVFTANLNQEAVLKTHLDDLAGLGFGMDGFGEKSYLVRQVPAVLEKQDWQAALGDLLDSRASVSHDSWQEYAAISLACHSAVRAGQVLDLEEMRDLIRQLELADNPHTCPHGRPVMVKLSLEQLGRDFART